VNDSHVEINCKQAGDAAPGTGTSWGAITGKVDGAILAGSFTEWIPRACNQGLLELIEDWDDGYNEPFMTELCSTNYSAGDGDDDSRDPAMLVICTRN